MHGQSFVTNLNPKAGSQNTCVLHFPYKKNYVFQSLFNKGNDLVFPTGVVIKKEVGHLLKFIAKTLQFI
jgi:hypothetical protein